MFPHIMFFSIYRIHVLQNVFHLKNRFYVITLSLSAHLWYRYKVEGPHFKPSSEDEAVDRIRVAGVGGDMAEMLFYEKQVIFL